MDADPESRVLRPAPPTHTQQAQYASSVDIRPEWRVVEQVNFTALTKLSLSVPEPQEVRGAGSHRGHSACLCRTLHPCDRIYFGRRGSCLAG